MNRFKIRFNKPFIGGKWLQTKISHPLISPNSEELLLHIHHNNSEHVHDAIRNARRTFDSKYWGRSSDARNRRRILLDIAQALSKHREEIAWLECLTGKPIQQARFDIDASVECFEYFAGAADKIHGRTYHVDPMFQEYTIREPIGVCGVITSFNYPLLLAAWKIAPALAAGNTIIVKPSPQTPLSVLYLAHLFQEHTDLPEGALQIIMGDADVGSTLSKHPDVDLISFTGSTNVGKIIAQDSAIVGPRPNVLELGGKASIIVCADADIDAALDSVVNAAFSNMGQNCCAGSKLYLEESIHDRFLSKLKDKVEKLRLAPSYEELCDIGPLVDKKQMEKSFSFINNHPNIPILTGGSRLYDRSGYFVPPTVFYNVPETCALSQEEIFGPVLSVLKPFTKVEDAISGANSTIYGLAAGFWSTSRQRINLATRTLRAGIVWVNHYNESPPWLPFGGTKKSGYGKDLGLESMNAYLITKSVQERI